MNQNIEVIVIVVLAVALVTAIVACLFLLLRGRRATADERIREGELKIARFESEAASLRASLTEKAREIESGRAEIDRLRADFAAAEERARSLGLSAAADAERASIAVAAERRARDEAAEHSAARRLLEERIGQLDRQTEESGRQLASLLDENRLLGRRNSELEARLAASDDKLATLKGEIEQIRAKSHLEFESIANRLLESKSEKFTASNRENIEQILLPLKSDIANFKQRVEQVYESESKDRTLLGEQVRSLIEKSDQVSAEANNLATALKGQSKAQGNWGELILERVLEANGLQRDREFSVQYPHKDDDGNQQFLDVVVHLPDNRKLIIDSKVTLNAYERYCASDNDGDREQHLREHLIALTNHIDQLSAKKYFDMENAADFVMLFVPVEPAYLTAIQRDGELWSRAYKKKVVLISPTNLMAAVKLVADLWSRDRQNRNTLKIAEQGGKLYDKFVGFLKDIENVGLNLQRTQTAYGDALTKLRDGRGNLISRAEKLKALGVTSSKVIPAALAAYGDEDDDDAGDEANAASAGSDE